MKPAYIILDYPRTTACCCARKENLTENGNGTQGGAMGNFLANVTFWNEETGKSHAETHFFSTNGEYPTVEEALHCGVIQGDWMVVSRLDKESSVINASVDTIF